MFAALELERYDHTEKGIFGALFSIISRPAPWLELAECLSARYYVIHAPDISGGLDWKAVEKLAGRFAGRMLLPDGLTPPPGSSISEPRCPRFEKRVLLSTACELIDRTRMPMYRRVLGMIDPAASFADFLSPLLHHYTSVRVVTENPAVYERAADRMMEELGAPVLVGESLSLLEGCTLTLAPDNPPSGAIFAGGERISDLRAGVPGELARSCPYGISPDRFAAALYDFCHADPGIYAAESMLFGHRYCGISEAAQIIAEKPAAFTL